MVRRGMLLTDPPLLFWDAHVESGWFWGQFLSVARFGSFETGIGSIFKAKNVIMYLNWHT